MGQRETTVTSSVAARAPLQRSVLGRGSLPAALERRTAIVERRASAAGIDVLVVGTAELFNETRLLVGDKSWVVVPVGRDPTLHRGRLPVPADQRRRLYALAQAGCDFPVVYAAHEVDPSKVAQVPLLQGAGTIGDGAAAHLVGAAPPPARAAAQSRHLGDITAKVGRAARSVLSIAGAASLLPVLAAGAVAAGLAGAAGGLDPVLFGVVTASGRAAPGQIGAWVIIAQWTW